jgi:hypothetical protein
MSFVFSRSEVVNILGYIENRVPKEVFWIQQTGTDRNIQLQLVFTLDPG